MLDPNDFEEQMKFYRENRQGKKNENYPNYPQQQYNNSISTMNYPQNDENNNELPNYEYGNEQENGSKTNTMCWIVSAFVIIFWIIIIFLIAKSIHPSSTSLP